MNKHFFLSLIFVLTGFLMQAQTTCSNVSYSSVTTGNNTTFTAIVPAGYVINNYYWNFGDGGTSTASSPTHTYANGMYYACMVVSGTIPGTIGGFQCTYCDSIYIGPNGGSNCNASFYSTVSGSVASFTNTSTGSGTITGYNWTFGDGGTSNLPNPSHTYAANGIYNTCLTINGIDLNGLSYTCTYCDSVNIQTGGGTTCNANFSHSNGTSGLVNFTDLSTASGTINGWSWTFGDGGTSSSQNPTHTYANNGWYQVCLTVYNNNAGTGFQCTWCDSVYVSNAGGGTSNCNASFISAQSGNTVAFTNTASGPGTITGYSWNFGDGGTSSLPNPTHTYLNGGSYNVCLTITGISAGLSYTCVWCDSVTISNTGSTCNANYVYTSTGTTFIFNNTSTAPGPITGYSWNFGDGGTSSLANPTHTYSNSGWYQVCLTIWGGTIVGGFQCTYCDSIYVSGGGTTGCNASFLTTVSGSLAAFTNTSTAPGTITSYAWTFGDGGTSSLTSPTHTYATGGSYLVCLTISGIDSNNTSFTCTYCDSVTIQNTGGGCNANFIYSSSGNTVSFSNTSTAPGPISGYSWTFGDGGTSTLSNPTHTYASSGWYYVCLTIYGGSTTGGNFQCSFCDSIYVGSGSTGCNAGFTALYTGGGNYNFTNTSTGGTITAAYWTFGDGGTSTLISPSHTYAVSGFYNVCLVVTVSSNGTISSCTYCDSLYVQTGGSGGGNCLVNAGFNQSISGLTANFTNTTSCVNCTSTTYTWNFGDGTGSNLMNPTHTYNSSGNYNVCLYVYGIDSNQQTCTDTICHNIVVGSSGVNNVNMDANELVVYPNPGYAYTDILLPGAGNYTLRLTDITGQTIRLIQLGENQTQTYRLDLNGLAPGMYTILLSDQKAHRYHRQLIKQ
ncbi:MAG: PKD domain-containing protein [Chitinophagaceae bacterium]|nr:PKD domain-containing protein [Chitinophagaceae bacterium]